MQTKIAATLYRGGTSKGPLFLAEDLPRDRRVLDRVLLAAMGSPHPRQIDGIGGAESLTSKVAIVSKSNRPGIDVDYLFAQVTPDSDVVDYSSNCGNMLSAIGSFAVEKGLVRADPAGHTTVKVFNINTDSPIVVQIATPDGQVTYAGDTRIDGVPGSAAEVRQNFAGTVGSKTKKLLPTGQTVQVIDGVQVTCIDVAVPAVIIAASDLGKTGYETKAQLDADKGLIERLNKIRIEAGYLMGMGDCSALVVPKPLMVAPPRTGGTITSRDFVPYNCHATHSVTGAMALATACALPGSIAQKVAGPFERGTVTIEHPSGTMAIEVDADASDNKFVLHEANLLRTCRKLFEGFVFIPAEVWDGNNKAQLCEDII
jgi:4-oxalomesaconate tautomerase